MKDSEVLGRSDYIRLVLWIAGMAVPVALLTLLYLILYNGGTLLVWETLPDTLNIPRPVYTVLVGVLGGLLVGLGLRYLGVRHGESLQKEMEAGRVPYNGVPGLVVTALAGLISGASLGPEGPLGHMGAAVGSWLSVRLKLSLESSRIMTLGGISAAFGGFLVQPLGGGVHVDGIHRFAELSDLRQLYRRHRIRADRRPGGVQYHRSLSKSHPAHSTLHQL